MTQNRYYSSTAAPMTLAAAITSTSATTFTTTTASGLPNSYPFTLVIDWGQTTQEVVSVTNVAGSSNPYTITCVRGIDGSTPSTHAVVAGSVVHAVSAQDWDEAAKHAASTSPTTSESGSTVQLHGIQSGSSVVGTTDTQILSNKTLASPAVTGTASGGTFSGATLASPAFTGTSTGGTFSGATIASPTITGTVSGGTYTGATLTSPSFSGGGANGTADWFNVKDPRYGATGNGTTDDTTAIQAAINAAAVAGGTVYFPLGNYKISSGLTYSAHYPVKFKGNTTAGQQNGTYTGSTIHANLGNSGRALAITNATFARIEDLDFSQDSTITFTAANDFDAIYLGSMNYYSIQRVQVYDGAGNYSFNTAINLSTNAYGTIDNCVLTGEVQAVWDQGSSGGAGLSLSNTQMTTTAGNGYGAVRMDGTAATLAITNCFTYRGDCGFTTGTATGNNPVFININNFQVNNPRVYGMYFGSGSQVWINQAWISFAGTPNTYTTEGIHLSGSFQGDFYLNQSTVQGPSNNGIYIGGGSGINIVGCSIGGEGWGANATYYGINLNGANPRIISITGCHFDCDEYNSMTGNSNKPNAALGVIYSGGGPFHITSVGNIASSGYASGGGTYTGSGATAPTTAGNINM
jgi:hypothetical protein